MSGGFPLGGSAGIESVDVGADLQRRVLRSGAAPRQLALHAVRNEFKLWACGSKPKGSHFGW